MGLSGRERIKSVVERSDNAPGRAFDWFIQITILTSIICFCIETVPDITERTKQILHYMEIVAVAIFTAEYLLRLWVADKWWRFSFSFFGLVDFFAVAPFYLSMGIDLRGLRAIRFLRVFQLFKLMRYSKAMRLYLAAFKELREELAVFVAAAIIVVFLASVGIYYFEHDHQPESFGSIFHCMWWAVVTMTTVGYGDVYPVTIGGKMFTGLVLLVGLGVVAVPTGLFASALTKARQMRSDEATVDRSLDK